MGAGSSRDAAGLPAPRPRAGSGRRRSLPSVKDRLLGSACFRSRQVSSGEENEGNGSRMNIKPCTVEFGQSSFNLQDVRHPQVNLDLTNIVRLGEDNVENISQVVMVSDRSSASASAKKSKFSVRFRSRFSFFHKGSVFKISRSASGGSAGTYPIFSRSLSTPAEEVNHVNRIEVATSNNSSDTHQQSITDAASSASPIAINMNPIDGVGRSQMNVALSDILGASNSQRRSQEPSEGTSRFSRSRSVGRLRDRVLHRTIVSEGRSGVITSADEAQGYVHQDSRMLLASGAENVPSIGGNFGTPVSSMNYFSSTSRSIENYLNPDLEENTSRDDDRLEYRPAFLERRRRIRSQIRALQRLSTRFESLSGHERSCILSGQHRTGCCSCRTASRAINSSDDTSTRASVSRIVVLAEALFEVLDEIHQQAAVLASRPSLSSIGAVPAPKEVVDCMPIKLFTGLQKCPSDEAAQCYICLVEYEEGDSMRVLPCCHEFHQACVDKWLKEVHRVCPLCRGDVCISEVARAEGHERSSA